MWIAVIAVLLPVILWLYATFWLGRYRYLGVIASPFVAVGLFQYIGYLAVGYLDPFALVAIIVGLVISVGIVVSLELFNQKIGNKLITKLQAKRFVITIFATIFCGVSFYPALDEVHKRVQLRASVDQLMLEDAKIAAISIVESQITLPLNYELNSTYDKSSNRYEFIFSKNDNLVAKVRLDAVTLKKISLELSPAL